MSSEDARPTRFSDPAGWEAGTPDMYGNVTFTGPGATCCSDPVCVFIPRCLNSAPGTFETITLVDPPNPGTCSPYNSSVRVDMKKADETTGMNSSDSGGQNYPNPLGASSGFNTTIPFATSTGGVATITVVNEKGMKILSDDEELLGAGQHFFYFSATDLPSGTYYYTIEFPQGVVIANKTMLVVK